MIGLKIFVVILIISCCNIFGQKQQEILFLRKMYLQKKISTTTVKQLENSFFDYPEDVVKNLILFEFYLDRNELSVALQYAQQLQPFYPINQLVNFRLGKKYFDEKKFEESTIWFEHCIKNDSQFHEARKFLAKNLYNLARYKEAYRHYNVLSWFKPDKEDLVVLEYLSSYVNQKPSQLQIQFSSITTTTEILNTPYIQVGISTKDNGKILRIDAVKFYVSDKFVILDDKDEKILECEGGTENEWTVVYRERIKSICIISPYLNKEYRKKSKFITIKPVSNNATIVVKEYKWFKSVFPINKEFRGVLVIKQFQDQIIVTNKLFLEEYLYSVVTKEIGKDKPEEALKTQAVVARTLALFRKYNNVHKHFDVCWGQHCQVYDGVKSESTSTIKAVKDTIGEVVVYNDKLVHPFFHANCGGITSSGEIFGVYKEYLASVCEVINTKTYEIQNLYYWYLFPPDIYCKQSTFVHAGFSRWCRVVEQQMLSKYLNEKYKIGKLNSIEILTRLPNGYITKIKLCGSNKNKILTKEHMIRNIVPYGPLRSTSFFIEYNENTKCYYFWGGGWGHGVGMCQSGVCNLAEQKENYVNIIKHYYPTTEVKKIY